MENLLLIVTRDGMGSGPVELQTVLVINFFKTLLKENLTPRNIFFYADGVKLNTTGSEIEDELFELEKRGASLVTCTTCLNFYDLASQLATGKKGSMADLVRLMSSSEKVISI
jgi:sulfur relay (sulfurtransferase) complex TusBCD TusD component (DsrE family)